MRIFSGIQPTGDKHLGNYIGGFRQYAQTQELGEAYFCIVDLHSITVDHDPRDLHDRTLDLFAMLIATGLDPERSTVFAQSHVTAHAEASWLLSAVTSYGQLGRMTQFKDKADRREFVSAGLFTYPVLMAGDILLYQTDRVPIGDDQRQHLELARDVAERFNSRFGETFVVPDGIYPEVGARIMDLQEPTRKMSTTGGTEQGTVKLLDEPDVIRKKFRSAVTDSGREIRRAPDKPGVANLIDILSVATQRTPEEIEAAYEGSGYGDLKRDVGEAVVDAARPGARAVPRAPRRRAGAPAPPRGRRGQGPRRLRADARGDVRADGLREARACTRTVIKTLAISAVVLAVAIVGGVLHFADAEPVVTFVGLRDRARRRGVDDRDRDRVRRRAVRPGRDGRAPVDARQPSRALHRPLRALGRRARRRAVLDPRLALRERAARARPRDRRRVDEAPGRHDDASARGSRTTPRRCCCSRCS